MFLFFLVFGVVAADFDGRRHGDGDFGRGGGGFNDFEQFMRPDFLRGVNYTVLQDWQTILQSNKTIADQQSDQIAFGNKYNIAATVQAWQQNLTAIRAQMAQNITNLINQLPQALQNLQAIFNNKNQTFSALLQSLEAFRNTTGPAADALFCLGKISCGQHEEEEHHGVGGGSSFPRGSFPNGGGVQTFPNFPSQTFQGAPGPMVAFPGGMPNQQAGGIPSGSSFPGSFGQQPTAMNQFPGK